MSTDQITSLCSAPISALRAYITLVVVVAIVTAQESSNAQQQQQQFQQPMVPAAPVPVVPGNPQALMPIQARQFYYPQQQGFYPQNQLPYGQQYPQYPSNFNQYQQYPQYLNQGQYIQGQQGFGNPSGAFYRPPVTATTTASTASTASTAATTTTTTPRPLQVGVSTIFPLVGAGTGFGRPGSNNILAGQQSAFNSGFYPYFQG